MSIRETSNEVRLIFDRYDLPLSLKAATREIRQGGQDPAYYKITKSTQIAKVSMKRLLSHTRTKMEQTIQHAADHGRWYVVAWECTCAATHKDVAHLQSIQEEADTKMMLHALDATADGATEIQIHSLDTDVWAHYQAMVWNSAKLWVGKKRRQMPSGAD